MFDAKQVFSVLGGTSFLSCASIGGLFGYWYYNMKLRSTPATFYVKTMLTFSRIALGATVGGWAGYMKFGDRQRL